jgi:hypothetical protein
VVLGLNSGPHVPLEPLCQPGVTSFLNICVGRHVWIIVASVPPSLPFWFELRASCFQSGCSTTWASPPVWNVFIYLFFGGTGVWASCLLGKHSYHLSHSTGPFLCWVFRDRVSRTIYPGWLQTMILLIAASWVARIMGVSHWCPAWNCFLTSVRWSQCVRGYGPFELCSHIAS